MEILKKRKMRQKRNRLTLQTPNKDANEVLTIQNGT